MSDWQTLGLITLIGAVDSDLREQKIENAWLALMALLGMGLALGQARLADDLTGMLVSGSLLFPLFALGAVGAGDVKLVMVLCGMLEEEDLSGFLLSLLVMALILSLEILVCDRLEGREGQESRDAVRASFCLARSSRKFHGSLAVCMAWIWRIGG